MKEEQKISTFSRFVTEHPWWIILFTLVSVLAMGAGVVKLGLKTDYRVYFSEQNPQLLAFNEIQDTYNKSDAVLFVLQPADGNVFTPQTLQAVQELTKKSWKIPYSIRVDSVTNFQHTQAEEDDLIVADLVVDSQASAEEIQKIRQVAITEPLLVNRLVSQQGHVTGVNVIVQLPGKDPMEALEVATSARALVTELENKYPGMKVYLTGMAMMTNAFSESSMDDNKTLVPIHYVYHRHFGFMA